MEIQTKASKRWMVSVVSLSQGSLWLRDDLEEVYALFFRFLGFGFQLALCNVGWLAEVRHSGARSHRLRSETSAARPRRALRHLSIHFFPASCLFLCYTPITSPSAAEAVQRVRLDEEQEEHGQLRLAVTCHGLRVMEPVCQQASLRGRFRSWRRVSRQGQPCHC